MYIACGDGIYKYTQLDGSDPELEYANSVDSIAIESLDDKNKIVFASKDNITIAGQITTNANINVEDIARSILKNISIAKEEY